MSSFPGMRVHGLSITGVEVVEKRMPESKAGGRTTEINCKDLVWSESNGVPEWGQLGEASLCFIGRTCFCRSVELKLV